MARIYEPAPGMTARGRFGGIRGSHAVYVSSNLNCVDMRAMNNLAPCREREPVSWCEVRVQRRSPGRRAG